MSQKVSNEELWKKLKEVVRQHGEVNRFRIAYELSISPYKVYELAKTYADTDPDVAYDRGTFIWLGSNDSEDSKGEG